MSSDLKWVTTFVEYLQYQATKTSEAIRYEVYSVFVLFFPFRFVGVDTNASMIYETIVAWTSPYSGNPHSEFSVSLKFSNLFGFDIMVTRNSHIDEEVFTCYFLFAVTIYILWPQRCSLLGCRNPIKSLILSGAISIRLHTSYIGTNADERLLYHGGSYILSA